MTEHNKAMYRRFMDEVMVKGNVAVLDDYLAPDFVDHSSFNPTGNVEGLRQGIDMMRSVFSDVEGQADDVLADGDKVVARYSVSATHTGEFMGAAPTGKRVTFGGIEIIRFSGGKMVEHWEQWDALGLMQQLGVVPATE